MRPYSIRISGLSLTVMRYRKTELWKSSGALETRLAETALNNTLLCIFTAKLDMHFDQAKIWRSRHNQESLTITAVRLKTVRFVLKYKEPSQSIYSFYFFSLPYVIVAFDGMSIPGTGGTENVIKENHCSCDECTGSDRMRQ